MVKKIKSLSPPPRMVRCGQCIACFTSECGYCRPCLNMKKNGGPGTSKAPCDKRRCLLLSRGDGRIFDNGSSHSHSHSHGNAHANKAKRGLNDEPSKFNLDQPPFGKEYTDGVWKDATGKTINYDITGVCAGCQGSRDEEVAKTEEPILLCDGAGCGREYHLKCAKLANIPDNEFFCSSCSIEGTSKQLLEYFEECDSLKSVAGSSYNYVCDVIEGLGLKVAKAKSEVDDYEVLQRIAMREIPAHIKKWMPLDSSSFSSTTAASTASTEANNQQSSSSIQNQPPAQLAQPVSSLLIGQTLRLYCPPSNTYHIGRIIDTRTYISPFISGSNFSKKDRDKDKDKKKKKKKTKRTSTDDDESTEYTKSTSTSSSSSSNSESSSPTRKFFGNSSLKASEFLVRFRSGTSGRKVPVHRWLLLEEHALAVSLAVVWGGVQGHEAWPAQIVVRSGIEMVHARDCKEKDDRRVKAKMEAKEKEEVKEVGGSGKKKSGSSSSSSSSSTTSKDMVVEEGPDNPALALFFGEETNAMLSLTNECTSFISPAFAVERTCPEKFKNVACSMAAIEIEEQRRVRSWHGLKSGGDGIEESMVGCDGEGAVSVTENNEDGERGGKEGEEEGRSLKRKGTSSASTSSSSTSANTNTNANADASIPPRSSSLISISIDKTLVCDLAYDSDDETSRKRIMATKVSKAIKPNPKAMKRMRRQENN